MSGKRREGKGREGRGRESTIAAVLATQKRTPIKREAASLSSCSPPSLPKRGAHT
jgi:hypothetical protein